MIYAFGACVLNTQLHALSYAGQPVNLRPKAFDVLVYLVEHRHRVVIRQELREQVWPDQFISDATLSSTLRTVRQAIGDNGAAQQTIQTVHGYGYRCVVTVTVRTEARAIQQVGQFQHRSLQSMFMAFLGEAYRVQGDREQAHHMANQGLDIAPSVQHWCGVVMALRVLSRLAQAHGALADAATYLQEALQICTAFHMRYALARTHLDLATVVHLQGNHTATATHLYEAYTVFRALQVPKWAECTAQRARELRISLIAEHAEGTATAWLPDNRGEDGA